MMKRLIIILGLLLALVVPIWAEEPDGETAGNNLSVPVIWADGKAKVLRGEFGVETFLGAWWYWWWVDPVAGTYAACAPDPDDVSAECEAGLCHCDDGVPMQVGPLPGVDGSGTYDAIAYPQQDPLNEWQAESVFGDSSPLYVHWVDWGDSLESVDWNLRSQVRAEVILIQDLVTPMLQYEMLHLEGWGISELWGTSGVTLEGYQATVYSHCARFMIQKLNVPREDPVLESLVWVPGEDGGWTDQEGELINAPIFNMAVYEAGDGPGYYNAEINVKGRVIFGYTWNVRLNNEGKGDYRLTFSFDSGDQVCGGYTLNTFFDDGTQIVPVAEEEELLVIEGGDTGGAVPFIDVVNNLTYIDVRIEEKEGGNGGGGNGNGGKPQ